MKYDSVVRCLEGASVVALLAAVPPWYAGKLPMVLIFVAVHALRKFDLVAGRLACRLMTRGALYFRVWKH
jgi:hypothetical protein